MGITFGDHLIDSGHYDPPEEERPMPEKTATDAPAWYNAEQADAWANGYNARADDPITAEEYFRGTLKVIAHWSEVDLSGEWETGLRGVIRSITDAAKEVLSAHPEKRSPAIVVEVPNDDEVSVWLREIDSGTDNACWLVCAEGDLGAVEFTATVPRF